VQASAAGVALSSHCVNKLGLLQPWWALGLSKSLWCWRAHTNVCTKRQPDCAFAGMLCGDLAVGLLLQSATGSSLTDNAHFTAGVHCQFTHATATYMGGAAGPFWKGLH
jgi:hypothetical protein